MSQVDLRTITLGVPPQEVYSDLPVAVDQGVAGAHQGLGHGVRGRSGLLQSLQCHGVRSKC